MSTILLSLRVAGVGLIGVLLRPSMRRCVRPLAARVKPGEPLAVDVQLADRPRALIIYALAQAAEKVGPRLLASPSPALPLVQSVAWATPTLSFARK
jgi:hypothetical protein